MAASKTTVAQREALDLLIEDHRTVQQMFRDFAESDDAEQRLQLVRAACTALTIHTQMEEEVFYPAVREVLASEDIVDEAEVEHEVAKNLIAELDDMEPGDALFEARFKVLGEAVNHHIDHEEHELFPQLEAENADLGDLADRLRECKAELEAEYDPATGDEDDGEE